MRNMKHSKGVARIFTLLLVGALAIGLLTGCSAGGTTEKTNSQQAQTDNSKISKDNPLVVDKAAKTVKVYSEVNGKYFLEPTRHGVVFKDGSNGNKSILKAYANQIDFYNALIGIGSIPGNNVTLETKNAVVEGSQLDVSVTWDGLGKEIPFQDIFTDSTKKPLDIRVGGNLARSEAKKTGCILCLDTCPVGITSNASHPQGSFDSKAVEFKGNKDVLPADGTPVTVIFKLK